MSTTPNPRIRPLLDNEEVQRRFPHVRWVEECTSTNTVLADEARSGDSSGSVLIADRQTAGKGRLGRVWETPIGATLPVSLRTKVRSENLGLVPLVVGLAGLLALETMGVNPGKVELKWPNDLMDRESGRKLAGILCEAIHPSTTDPTTDPTTGPEADPDSTVIIGIGINVNRPVDGSDLNSLVIDERAYWLSDVLNDVLGARGRIAMEVVAMEVCAAIARNLDALEGDRVEVHRELVNRIATLGRSVQVVQVHRTWEGLAIGLSGNGALVVQRNDGSTEEVHAGDVTHLR